MECKTASMLDTDTIVRVKHERGSDPPPALTSAGRFLIVLMIGAKPHCSSSFPCCFVSNISGVASNPQQKYAITYMLIGHGFDVVLYLLSQSGDTWSGKGVGFECVLYKCQRQVCSSVCLSDAASVALPSKENRGRGQTSPTSLYRSSYRSSMDEQK